MALYKRTKGKRYNLFDVSFHDERLIDEVRVRPTLWVRGWGKTNGALWCEVSRILTGKKNEHDVNGIKLHWQFLRQKYNTIMNEGKEQSYEHFCRLMSFLGKGRKRTSNGSAEPDDLLHNLQRLSIRSPRSFASQPAQVSSATPVNSMSPASGINRGVNGIGSLPYGYPMAFQNNLTNANSQWFALTQAPQTQPAIIPNPLLSYMAPHLLNPTTYQGQSASSSFVDPVSQLLMATTSTFIASQSQSFNNDSGRGSTIQTDQSVSNPFLNSFGQTYAPEVSSLPVSALQPSISSNPIFPTFPLIQQQAATSMDLSLEYLSSLILNFAANIQQ